MSSIFGLSDNLLTRYAPSRTAIAPSAENSVLGSDNPTPDAGDGKIDASRQLRLVEPSAVAFLSPAILETLIGVQAQQHDASPTAPQAGSTTAKSNAPLSAADLLAQARADIDSIFAGPGKDSAQLGDALTARLKAAGVDTTKPIRLSVGPDGSILANGDNPDKAKIEKVFADDPPLGNLYRKVSEENYFAALGPLVARYSADYGAATSQAAGTDVWRNYQPLFNELGGASGHLVLANGRLTSSQ
jgi:hypothetical protein